MEPQIRKENGNGTHKIMAPFAVPTSAPKPNHRFVKIPSQFIKPASLSLDLSSVITPAKMNQILAAKKMCFHAVGDTGGINGTETQDAIAKQMEEQVVQSTGSIPAFLYHLGDVVYYNGVSTQYSPQFYEPYQTYPNPILAIPGNHDCDTQTLKGDPADNEVSLFGFMTNFCDPSPHYGPFSSYRMTMNQPWPYWVLNTPYATLIGLFSNVDGSFDAVSDKARTQFSWLVAQLKSAPTNKCLILSAHHPCFSLDTTHGGYPIILSDLDEAFKKSGRKPDLVLSGHVHNYQRFTRTLSKTHIPYVIAGAGGFANQQRGLHKIQKDPKGNLIKTPFQTTVKGLVLEAYNQESPGFLNIEVDPQFIIGEYYINNFTGAQPAATPADRWKYDWTLKKLVNF